MTESEVILDEEEIHGTGITQYLRTIADDLLYISENEKDPDKKEEYYNQIFKQLEQDEMRLHKDSLTLDEEAHGNITEFLSEINDVMREGNILFMEAIGMMIEFTNTDNSELLAKALDSINEADGLLDRAEELNDDLKAFLDEQDKQAGDNESAE